MGRVVGRMMVAGLVGAVLGAGVPGVVEEVRAHTSTSLSPFHEQYGPADLLPKASGVAQPLFDYRAAKGTGRWISFDFALSGCTSEAAPSAVQISVRGINEDGGTVDWVRDGSGSIRQWTWGVIGSSHTLWNCGNQPGHFEQEATSSNNGTTPHAELREADRWLLQMAWSNDPSKVLYRASDGDWPGCEVCEQPESCGSDQAYGAVDATYIDDELSVFFGWEGPEGLGWNVYVPDPGNPPYPAFAMQVPASQVEGYQGIYGSRQTIAGLSGTDLRVVNRTGEGPGCFTTGPLRLTGDHAGPEFATLPDGSSGAVTDESGASCGVNLFCWIKAALKWAFWPGDATANAFDNLKGAANSAGPTLAVSQYWDWLMAVKNHFVFQAESAEGPGAMCHGGEGTGLPAVCWLEELGEQGPVSHLRTVLRIMLWGTFAWLVWRKIKQRFSDTPEHLQAEDPVG